MDSKRSVKRRRLSSSQLLRIGPEDPCYNFNFLGLPLEIKLLIICRYLSVENILTMSLISKDYKHFIDQHFLRKEVELPRCLDEFERIKKDRYVLSLNVNFDEYSMMRTSSTLTVRERTLKVIKRLNFSKMENVSLVNSYTNQADMTHDFLSDRSGIFSYMSICPWYAEISLRVFKNPTLYLQSVDFTIFKCKASLRAIEELSKNAPFLREVTLRGPQRYIYHCEDGKECYSLSAFVACLLEKTAITHLELHNFLELPSVWRVTPKDAIRVQSKTLKSLNFHSTAPYYENEIGAMEIICPNLEKMMIFSLRWSRRCLFHVRRDSTGLASSLAKHCPKLKWFNYMPVEKDSGYSIRENGRIVFHRLALCSKTCEDYFSYTNSIDY